MTVTINDSLGTSPLRSPLIFSMPMTTFLVTITALRSQSHQRCTHRHQEYHIWPSRFGRDDRMTEIDQMKCGEWVETIYDCKLAVAGLRQEVRGAELRTRMRRYRVIC